MRGCVGPRCRGICGLWLASMGFVKNQRCPLSTTRGFILIRKVAAVHERLSTQYHIAEPATSTYEHRRVPVGWILDLFSNSKHTTSASVELDLE